MPLDFTGAFGGGGGYDLGSTQNSSTGPATVNVGGFNVPAYRGKTNTALMVGAAVVGLVALAVLFKPKRKKGKK